MSQSSQINNSLTKPKPNVNLLSGGSELTVSGPTRATGDEGSPAPDRGSSHLPEDGSGRVTELLQSPVGDRGEDCLGVQGVSPPALVHLYKKVNIVSVAEAVARAGLAKDADKIAGCGTMGKRYRCRDCGYEWTVGDWCNHRLCPECGKRRAYALFNAHKRLAGRPNLKHLVLTFKNFTGLSWDSLTWSTVDWVRKCFTKLRRRKLFRKFWQGGLYSIEFTFSKATGWHIHIHALVDGAYIPQSVISAVWLEITGNSDVIWVSRAKNSRQVLKYILKPSQELLDDAEALNNFLTVVQRRHFVSGWGKWYRVTEKQLTNWERVCPECGSKYIVFVGWAKVDARGPPIDRERF